MIWSDDNSVMKWNILEMNENLELHTKLGMELLLQDAVIFQSLPMDRNQSAERNSSKELRSKWTTYKETVSLTFRHVMFPIAAK